VHITVLSPPTVFVARDRHKLNLLASMADEYVNFISGLIVSERTLHDKPGVIKRALRALAKANRFFHANETATAEILAKYLNVSQQIAIETHRYSLSAYTRNGIPTDKEVDENLKADAQFLKLKEPVKSGAVFDFALQREVNNELGIK
jgi:ABC-type nitrate/sulfonate/bicarbonate transport system substrate-binding protein